MTFDSDLARRQRETVAAFLESWRERALQGIGIPGDADTISYILLGLAAEGHEADQATDAMTRFLLDRQGPDGQWFLLAHRPPIESSVIEVTAASMRSLQIYGKRHGAEADRAIRRAAAWIAQAQPETNEDRAFRLMGLLWAGSKGDAVQAAVRSLKAAQRPDGGWAQLGSLTSDAYATGQALVALMASGSVSARRSRAPPRRGVPDEHTARRWLVVRADARAGDSAVLRSRLPARPESVHLERRNQLGDPGAVARLAVIAGGTSPPREGPMPQRARFATLVVCAGLVLTGTVGDSRSTVCAQAPRPNIVLIFPDNLGWGEVGAYGSVRGALTPRIDKLAAEGIRLDNFNVEYSCTVSRAALMTGRYAIRSGATQPGGITLWEVTLAEALKSIGYATALFGKWHLGGDRPEGRTPALQGFDEYYGIPRTSNEAQTTIAQGQNNSEYLVPLGRPDRRTGA